MKKSFCSRLKELRGSKSQAEFAKVLGLSQVVYGRYELGTREPNLDGLIQIGLKLGVSINWILGFPENQPSTPISTTGVKKKVKELKEYANIASKKADELLFAIEQMEVVL